MSFDAAFLPFTVFFDWLRYYDRTGKSHELKPLLLHMMPNGVSKGYLSDTQYSIAAEEGLRAYLENPGYIEKVQKQYQELTDLIDKEYTAFFKGPSKMSEEKMFKLVKKLHQVLVEMVKITLPIERLDKSIVTSVLNNSVNLEKIWRISEMATFESFETRNSRYILNVLNKKQDIDLLRYIYTSYAALPSKADVKKEILKLDLIKLPERIKESEGLVKNNKRKREREVESLNDKEKKLLKYIDWVMEMRDNRKAYISKSEIQLTVLGQKLFSIWGLDPNLVAHMSILEMVRGKDYVLTNIEKLKARLGSYTALYLGDEGGIMQSTEDISASIRSLDNIVIKQHVEGEVNELKGEIGSRGKVRGKVQIILSTKEFGKFKDGNILVAPMTRPEYVPLMRKAAAIITDEGGITCHAAIVSRELGIPCIIGTKVATKILKDGDLVEVDAEKGIVKILKKA
jgi:phosphohistidine swiveling domain-containing protein